MGFLDVVKWNADDNEVVAMKFVTPRHDDQFNTGSRLIVSTGQEAVVLINGEMTGPFGPNLRGHIMNTQNLPILTTFIKKFAFFGNTPYPAEVWFIQVASAPDFGWGTQDPVEFGVPYKSNGMLLEFTAGITLYGKMEIHITDTLMFMKRLVQTKPVFTRNDLRTALNAKLMQILKPTLAKMIRASQISIRDIIFSQDVIAKVVFEEFAPQVAGYGLELLSFNVESIKLTPETAARVETLDDKAMEVAGESLERTTLGMSRKEERQLDVMESMASNQGAGVAMAPMMGLGLGIGMAGKFASDIMKVANVNISGSPANGLSSTPLGGATMPPPPPTAPRNYFLFYQNQQTGSFSFAQLNQMVQCGSLALTADTLVWYDGLSEWTPCGQLPEFAELLNKKTSCPPPPPIVK